LRDQFDEILSPCSLREECRSLLSQIKIHQAQIKELTKTNNELQQTCSDLELRLKNYTPHIWG
jgi:prefoldin subunit 5